MMKLKTERQFRGLKGWAPDTDYIEVNLGGRFVVKKDGTRITVHAYSLEYCLAQVGFGNWEEINVERELQTTHS
jgi:hypothetical protein